MKLEKECCTTQKLKNKEILYESNVDEFTLYECEDCKSKWLYRKIEETWIDNLRFQENDFEAWYIKIADVDLQKVKELKFDEILFSGNYVYIDTTSNIPRLKIIK